MRAERALPYNALTEGTWSCAYRELGAVVNTHIERSFDKSSDDHPLAG